MKILLKKMYDFVALIPITLFIYAGIYEMCFGNLLRGIINGNVSWIIPVTQTMVIDTIVTLILVFYLVNGLPKCYKQLSENNKTKGFALFLLIASIAIAVFLFVFGKLYLNKVLFNVNYILFMVILLFICIIQKVLDNIVFTKKKINHETI